MKSLHEQLPVEILAAIKEYNTVSKFNDFLYKNPDCNELFKTYEPKEGEPSWKSSYGGRDQFITRHFQIERELIPIVIELYHGKKVIVEAPKFEGGMRIEGTVVHHPTHTYSRGDGKEGITDNGVSFRGLGNGNALDEQSIALWIETGNRFTTHLYTADKIYLIESQVIVGGEMEEVDTPETDIYGARFDLNGNER